MISALQQYLAGDGVLHSLDMYTVAKQRFLETFESVILQRRAFDYRVQFTGPTGANAVEAALKLARKVSKRSNVIAFTQSYHGLSAGALSVTANSFYRNEAFINRSNVVFMPYDGYLGDGIDTTRYLRKVLTDGSSGTDLPAAAIVETVQAEGGVNVASTEWLRTLEKLCRELDILLIVDDIQVGCGRTGTFFSFERAGIYPDLVVLSKSISGIGLPMSLLLIRPELDQWKPGEHTGTFRGNNLAFVTATEALRYWEDDFFASEVGRKGQFFRSKLEDIRHHFPEIRGEVRGVGLILGLQLGDNETARDVSRGAFERGLIVELCGRGNDVLKFLPPLTAQEDVLEEGIEIVRESIAAAVQRRGLAEHPRPALSASSSRAHG